MGRTPGKYTPARRLGGSNERGGEALRGRGSLRAATWHRCSLCRNTMPHIAPPRSSLRYVASPDRDISYNVGEADKAESFLFGVHGGDTFEIKVLRNSSTSSDAGSSGIVMVTHQAKS